MSVRVTLDMTVNAPDMNIITGNITNLLLRTHTIVSPVGDTGGMVTTTTTTTTTTTAAPMAKGTVV